LRSPFVEITRGFLEQRVNGEFEVKFLSLKLSCIFCQCCLLAMSLAFLRFTTTLATLFAVGILISTT
jgi:hypothetical protein